MHFEILVEDASGEIALDSIVAKILAPFRDVNSVRIHSYKGIGRIPKDLKGKADPSKRILLTNLPRLLRGYGQSLHAQNAAVIILVDLDDRDLQQFRNELSDLLNTCEPKPRTVFAFAIEEGEAWFLGDRQAVRQAYPNVKRAALDGYRQDSICGTWEKLADAIYPGGAPRLKAQGWPVIGNVKCEWARRIGLHLVIDANQSPSFQAFHSELQDLMDTTT